MSAPLEHVVERAASRVGTTLKQKWRLDQLLGVGGMASVYAATHRNGGRAAIKMLHLELSLDARMRQRFLHEGYAANAVDHEGVVRVLDDDVSEDGSAFVVMELLTGETLEARRQRQGKTFDLGELLAISDGLLAILVAAHEKGVIHRDIKPENIFITHKGTIKLLDFGIARLRDGSSSATRTGLTLGTPAFMSPEQALGRSEEIGPACDIWGVGATMFFVLSGRFVHDAQTPNEIMIRVATQHAPSLGDVVSHVPRPVVAVIDRALRFQPTDRFKSASAMRKAIKKAYAMLERGDLDAAPRVQVPAREDEPEVKLAYQGSMRPPAPVSISPPPPEPGPVTVEAEPIDEATAEAVVEAEAPAPEPVADLTDAAASDAPEPAADPPAAPSQAPLADTDDPASASRRATLFVAAALVAGAIFVTLSGRGRPRPAAPPPRPSASAPLAAASPAASPASSPLAPPSASVSASPAPSSSVPVLSLSDLSQSVASASLDIDVTGGECDLSIDGKPHGKVRRTVVIVYVGEHEVQCTWPGGRSVRKSVKLDEGDRHLLLLDPGPRR